MTEILTVMLSFPAVFFTVITAVSVLYWLFVIIGALDMDTLGGAHGAHDGAIDGAIDGAHEGALEGAVGAAKGGLDVGGHHADGGDAGDADGDAGDADAGLLSFLRLRNAPMTVVISLFALFGLLLTGMYGLTFGVPSTLLGVPLFAGSVVVSTLLTSLAIRPLAPVFKTHHAQKSSDFVGKIATISTGKVTERFGQAMLEDGGAGQILEVRETSANELKRGDRVVLVYWDAEKEAFEVEKVPDIDGPRARIGGASADPLDDPAAPDEARDRRRA